MLTARAYTTQLLLCMLHLEQVVEDESDGVADNTTDLPPAECVWLCGCVVVGNGGHSILISILFHISKPNMTKI